MIAVVVDDPGGEWGKTNPMSLLEQITRLILTCNEAPNIGRTLEKLTWAREIVVVDYFSTDETLDTVKTFPPTRPTFRYGIPAVARLPKQTPCTSSSSR